MVEYFMTGPVFGYAAGFALCLFSLYLLYRDKRIAAERGSMLEDSFSLQGHGLIFFNANERFCLANRQAQEFLPFLSPGYEVGAEQVPRTLREFLNYIFEHAVDYDEGLRGAVQKFSGAVPAERFREVIRWGHGKLCLVELQRTPSGRIILSLADVSATKQHEDELIQLSRYNYEVTQAVDAATNGIVITDAGHIVIFANNAFCDHVNAVRPDLIGRSLLEILKGIAADNVLQSIRSSFARVEPGDLEIKITTPASTRWFNLKLTPVRGGEITGGFFIGVFSDTTALKIREAEFFQAQKLEAVGQLAAGVAHDFNNILSIIDGYSRMAISHISSEERARDYLQKIRMATDRGANLTRRMLTFSRNKIVTDSVVDLVQAVQDQEALIRPLVDASIDLAFTPSDENVFVECSPDTITQILMNLVINARDAMPRGGTLIIETRLCDRADMPPEIRKAAQDGAYACLSVIDTGEGMSKEIQARIFDPFFTTKEQGKGTGLGLSMVYGLVKDIGGHIGVNSLPGQGTAMSIYLPVSRSQPQSAAQPAPEDITNGMSLKGFTALLAEDEPDILELVSDMLDRMGMNVIKAANGNQALLAQAKHAGSIDLLLTDIVMPEMNGVSLADMLCALRPDMKVIFISGYPAYGGQAKAELPEGAYFMAKPIQYEALAGLIHQRLSNLADKAGGPRWQSADAVRKKGEIRA